MTSNFQEPSLPPSVNFDDFPMMLKRSPTMKKADKLGVIVCGLPRMGTSSIAVATWKLGLGPAYHVATIINNPEDAQEWLQALDAIKLGKGHFGRKEWDHLLRGCGTVCDAPSAWFSVELSKEYPDAKVIVLKRDFESWYKSYSSTILKARQSRLFILRSIFITLFDYSVLGQVLWMMKRYDDEIGGIRDKESAKIFYELYYKRIEAEIPADRRITYAVKDGWEPLCKHLGVEMPTKEFPQVNSSDSFNERVKVQSDRAIQRIMWKAVKLSLAVAVPVVGLGLAGKIPGFPTSSAQLMRMVGM